METAQMITWHKKKSYALGNKNKTTVFKGEKKECKVKKSSKKNGPTDKRKKNIRDRDSPVLGICHSSGISILI